MDVLPMTQVDDLSRSLAAFDQTTSLIVVVEMSEASWLVAGLVPGVDRQPLKKLAPDPDALLRLLERWQAEAVKAGQTIGRIALAYEAGRDGRWQEFRPRVHTSAVAPWRDDRTSGGNSNGSPAPGAGAAAEGEGADGERRCRTRRARAVLCRKPCVAATPER
jgi:hypothetical protein